MQKREAEALNQLTVQEFTEIFSEQVQDKMSELGFYVEDGRIYIK